MNRESLIEVLEARIAPANFFLSGASKAVVNQSGASVNDDARFLAGSDIAVALKAGDSLFLDADGNPATTTGQELLVRVTAGRALVFATDLGAMPDGHFDKNELTGIAVADAFEAKLHTGVKGTIVTALKEDGTLAVSGGVLTLQQQSIGGLNIDGAITGNIFAGADIRHVRVTGSVGGNLATGTAVNETSGPLAPVAVTLNGGTTLNVAIFAPADGTRGGDISDVQFEGGVKNVLAGNGDSDDKPGRGGSISHVSIAIDSGAALVAAPTIRAGNGGASNSAGGARGGDVTGVTVILADAASGDLQLFGGNGGRGNGSGAGGAGGAITDCRIVTSNSISDGALRVQGGAGGNATGTGAGGAGGAVSMTSLHLLDATASETVEGLSVSGGAGGESAGGAGGAGGAIVDLTLLAEAMIVSGFEAGLDITGGAGGLGKTRGGAGGRISGGSLTILGDVQVDEVVNIRAGDGGALQPTATNASTAGPGGEIAGLSVTLLAEMASNVVIASGAGGSAEDATAGTGGAGGRLSVSVTGRGVLGAALALEAGDGGAGPVGGAGGSIAETAVNFSGELDSFTANAGAGADGGAGGNIRALRVVLGSVSETVAIAAGDGGDSDSAAGAGGNVSSVHFTNFGDVAGLQILAGAGGPGGAVKECSVTNAGGMDFLEVTGGAGGGSGGARAAGGAIAGFVLESLASMGVAGAVFTGGAGGDTSAAGGGGGSIRNLSVHLLDAPLTLIAGNGGASTGAKAGGAGGVIRGITGAVDVATFIAGDGGDSASGAGGSGGAVRDVSLGLVGTFVRGLLAGDGGDGSKAGAGGAVRDVSIAGDVGDFASAFNFAPDEGELEGMGGIAAGQGGAVNDRVVVTKNGSIHNVTAARIAAMVAGRPDGSDVKNANAVLKIAKITASSIGADVDGDGGFDPGAFVPGGAATARDGFILVRAGGLGSLSAAVVLKLFEV